MCFKLFERKPFKHTPRHSIYNFFLSFQFHDTRYLYLKIVSLERLINYSQWLMNGSSLKLLHHRTFVLQFFPIFSSFFFVCVVHSTKSNCDSCEATEHNRLITLILESRQICTQFFDQMRIELVRIEQQPGTTFFCQQKTSTVGDFVRDNYIFKRVQTPIQRSLFS